MSAVGFLLEKQQVKKPYGLSINELLEGFSKKRDDESGKIIESSNTSQEKPSSSEQDICDITKSATTKKELSLFEQGICDYSTEHFYTLTNISDTERDIIKDLLREKIEQNTADKEKLSTASSQLEKSKEEQYKESKNLIIKHEYLKESFERFKQDTKRLEELRNKFNIKDTQSSESERKEDDSEKQRAISPLGDIETSKSQEATKLRNIPQQSKDGQKQRNI